MIGNKFGETLWIPGSYICAMVGLLLERAGRYRATPVWQLAGRLCRWRDTTIGGAKYSPVNMNVSIGALES